MSWFEQILKRTEKVGSENTAWNGANDSPPPSITTPFDEPEELQDDGSLVHIHGPNVYSVDRRDGKILLPTFHIKPKSPDLSASLASVVIRAESSNRKWAGFLEKAYEKSAKSIPGTLNDVSAIIPAPGVWSDQEPISDKTSTTLVVEVNYVVKQGADNQAFKATRSAKLYAGTGIRPTSVLRVEPYGLLRVYETNERGSGPQLRVRVSNTGAPEGQAVKPEISFEAMNLSEISARLRCAGLESAVEEMLGRIKGSTRWTDNGATINVVPRFELKPIDRESVVDELRRQKLRAIQIPVVVRATGAEFVELVLELRPLTQNRPGLIVFDLGHSTSTALKQNPEKLIDSEMPREQMEEIRRGLIRLLEHPPKSFTSTAQSTWLNLLKGICEACGLKANEDPAKAIVDQLSRPADGQARATRLFQVIKHLELQMWDLDPIKAASFQEELSLELYQLYDRGLERVPLDHWNIEICECQENKADFVVSDLELSDLLPEPVGVLGEQSAKNRLAWLVGKEPEPIGAIRGGRFFGHPKVHLTRIDDRTDLSMVGIVPEVFRWNGGHEVRYPIRASQILHAAWGSLYSMAAGQPNAGTPLIDHVAVTYPADLRPEARKQMNQTLREIGAVKVDLDFDESVSPAIFHLEKLFGGFEEIGCEAFKVRCVKEGNMWTHHMLVLDIGAGTTDISLIRIEMTERMPLHSKYGGKLYEVRPRLLGTAGRDQCGGHQLTLRLLRVLKQMLANWVQESQEKTEDEDDSVAAIGSAMRKLVLSQDDEALRPVLDEVEQIIPTRFAPSNSESQAKEPLGDSYRLRDRYGFLWQWAEDLKIHLSNLLQKTAENPNIDTGYETIDVGPTHLSERLKGVLSGTAYENRVTAMLKMDPPSIRVIDFVDLAQSAVAPSIKLATQLAKSALENFGKLIKSNQPLALQSVVLSGRACALPQVQELLGSTLKLDPILGGGKSEVLFRRDYAKSATAIGACRAQRRIAEGRRRTNQPPYALNGRCQMDLQIDNLFFYLPSSFRQSDTSENLRDFVFHQHTEFLQTGSVPRGLIRSKSAANRLGRNDWHDEFHHQPKQTDRIYRDDGDGVGVLWGELDIEDLIAGKNLEGRELRRELKDWRMQFEISHQNELSALIIRPEVGDDPNCIAPIFKIGSPAGDPQMIIDLDSKVTSSLVDTSEPSACRLDIYSQTPEPGRAPLVSAKDFRPIRCLSRTCESQPLLTQKEKEIVQGWMSPPLNLSIPLDGELNFFLAHPDKHKQMQGVKFLPRPKDPEDTNNAPESFPFRTEYRLVVTVDGRFALVIGEQPSYWETGDTLLWLQNPAGQILRRAMTPSVPKDDGWNDPFSGIH